MTSAAITPTHPPEVTSGAAIAPAEIESETTVCSSDVRNAAAVAFYERASGHPARDLHFYEVRAALRAALLLVRYSDYLVTNGTLAADAVKTPATPALVVLERLLDAG